jgi:hypothetical protein
LPNLGAARADTRAAVQFQLEDDLRSRRDDLVELLLPIFEKSIGKEELVEFLMHLLQHLSGPLLIIWDRLAFLSDESESEIAGQ